LVLLNFDFAKTYDKINWEFLFLTLKAMGMANEFIALVNTIQRCKSIVYITKTSKVEKGVKHECPLAPYMFIHVGEVLNMVG
jgi:hypothetical protein